MDRLQPALILLFAALLLSASAYAASDDNFKLKDAYWAIYQPGSTSAFYVILEYRGLTAASRLEATLSPGPASTAGSSTVSYSGEVKPGSLALLAFTFTTPSRPSAAYHEAELSLTYEVGGVERREELKVPMTVAGAPSLVVSASPMELKRGAVTEVSLTVRNEGTGVARLVSLSATSASPFLTVVGGGSLSLGLIPPGGSLSGSLKLHAQPTAPDSSSLTVALTYLDQFGNARASTISVGFTVEPPPPQLLTLSLDPSTIVPDSVNNIKLRVVNLGRLDAYNVSMSLAPSQGLVILGGNYLYFSRVEAGGWAWADLRIYAAPSLHGAAALTAQATYRDAEGRSYSLQLYLGLELGGGAEFKLLGTGYLPTAVFPGDREVVLQATLANLGPYTAEEVEVSLSLQGGITATYAGSTTMSLGTVAAGQARQLSFKVDLAEGLEPGRYELPLHVSFKGGSQQLTLPIEVSRKARFSLEEASFTPAKLRRDARGVSIALTLRNLEDVDAEQVRVRLLGTVLSGTTVAYLGTVPKGSRAVASFEVDVSPTAPLGSLDVEAEVLWAQRGRTLSQKLWFKAEVEEGGLTALLAPLLGAPWEVRLSLACLVVIVAAAAVAAFIRRRARAQP
jgi:hypothetical protein